MTNKERFELLLERYDDFSLFFNAWWLEAVTAGKNWDVLFSEDETGEVRAVMPYMIGKSGWMKYIRMPEYTRYGGIWVRPDLRDSIEENRNICKDVVSQLDSLKVAFYKQAFMLGSSSVNAMRELGFKIKGREAFRLRGLLRIDDLVNNFTKQAKNKLQKALTLSVDTDMTAEEFYQFSTEVAVQSGKKMSYSREFLLVLFQKAAKKNCVQILRLKNIDNVTVAAAIVFWDKRAAYYMFDAIMPQNIDNGAKERLMLEAMKYARQYVSEIELNDSKLGKSLSAEKVVYHTASKFYNKLYVFPRIVQWFKGIR